LQVRLSYCGAQVIVQGRFVNDSSSTTISIIGVVGAVHIHGFERKNGW